MIPGHCEASLIPKWPNPRCSWWRRGLPRVKWSLVGSSRNAFLLVEGYVAIAHDDLACTTGKGTGYYYRMNVRAIDALYDIRLPIRVIVNPKEGLVEAI